MNPALKEKLDGVSVGLTLSGGGFRAMLFHIGSLWRLNEEGVLPHVKFISSVSGGSIIGAYLGYRWHELEFREGVATNFKVVIARPLLKLSQRLIDISAISRGLFPFTNGPRQLIRAYSRHLFGDATLGNLPASGNGPMIRINAFVLETSRPWVFSRMYCGELYILESQRFDSIHLSDSQRDRTTLATAVAASSGFPPVLSPVCIRLDQAAILFPGAKPLDTLSLADGGVYDNSGLISLMGWPGMDLDGGIRALFGYGKYNTDLLDPRSDEPPGADVLFVSDGGALLDEVSRPWPGWKFRPVTTLKRTLDTAMEHRRQFIYAQNAGAFNLENPSGAWWEIPWVVQAGDGIAYITRLDPEGPFGHSQPALVAWGRTLTALPTRLSNLGWDDSRRLVNWGYAKTAVGLALFTKSPSQVKIDRLPYKKLHFNEMPSRDR